MFQFPSFPTHSYVFTVRYLILHQVCSHIRKSTGRCLFTANRGLSQLVTSFVGSWCQGIHLTLFFAWTYFWFSNQISLNCLSFVNKFLGYLLVTHWKSFLCAFLVSLNSFFHLSVKLFLPFLERPNSLLTIANLVKNFVLLICSFLLFNILYSVFNEHNSF